MKSKKGGNFERETAKYLSYWWTDGDRDDIIWHTHSSGGRATERLKKGMNTAFQYGDLCPTVRIAYPLFDVFLFELKRGYTTEVDLLAFVDKLDRNKDPLIFQWWNKIEKEREQAGCPYSLLIIKRDRHRRVVMFNYGLYKEMEENGGDWKYSRQAIIKYRGQQLVILLLNEFLECMVQEIVLGMRNDRLGRG